MANNQTNELVDELQKVNISSVGNNTNGEERTYVELYWGFSLHEAYSKAIKFYKDNDGKQTFSMLSYEDKLHLAALTKQVSHGPFNKQTNLPEIGYLDMFGHDRRRIWESFQDMSSNDARRNFLKSLEKAVPIFGPFMDAQRIQRDEEIRIQEEKRRIEEEKERQRILEEERLAKEKQTEMEKLQKEKIQMEEKEQIKAALNAQTLPQFQQYAAQQFPGNTEQQQALIAQLQEQHYQQYIQLHLLQQNGTTELTQTGGQTNQRQVEIIQNSLQENEDFSETPDDEEEVKICDASLWTRPQIEEFKEQIKRDPESVLTVGRGEVVTVRVPTHEEGAYIFWEFATDNYDLGFGVYFEWTDATSSDVSVHVNESSDEDEASDLDEFEEHDGGDIEKAPGAGKQKPLADEIVPVFRQECHTQIHAGSHRYPGRGIYLLKFDNSYSLWRSKTLYYRVYYTR